MSESARDKVRRTREEQGLPPELEDGPTLERIVDLLIVASDETQHRRAS